MIPSFCAHITQHAASQRGGMQSQRQVLGQLGDAIPSHEDEFEEFMIVRILLALGRTRGLAERSLRAASSAA